MKNLFKTFTAGILAATLCFSSACALGGNKGDNNDVYDGTTVPVRERYTYEGTHVMTAPEIDDEWLVKNGETDYVLVTPADASKDSNLNIAIDEFRLFFKKATGIDIKSVRDDSNDPVLSNAQAKRISIGLTTLVTGMTEEERKGVLGYDKNELSRDGVRIVKKDNTVYLLGGESTGVLYAVYDFLQICFNYEFYYRNCIQIDTGVRNLKMRDFDVTDIPDTDMRSYGNPIPLATKAWNFEIESGLITSTDTARAINRYRVYNCNYYYTPIFKYYGDINQRTYGYHSSAYFLPTDATDINGNKIFRSTWKGDDGVQLCYTAHGNDEDLEAMIDACVDKITYTLSMDEFRDRKYVGLTTMDGGTQCTCSACTELYHKDGGSYAGAIIRFCNRVMEKVQAWRAENGLDDNYKLYFFAYGPTEVPPVVEDANGNLIPANDEVICRDDLVTLCCTSNYSTSIYWPTEEYQARLDNIKNWSTVTKNLFNWFYQMNYLSYSTYHDSITQLNTDFYAYALNCGSIYMMNQGDWEGDNITSYGALNEYVFSKLMWNCSLNTEQLVKNFFKAMYKNASDTMYEIFELQRQHSLTVGQNNGTLGAGNRVDKMKYYPYKAFLEPIIELYEKALSEIEILKQTSPNEYELVKRRVQTEYVSPLYLALNFYGTGAVRPFDDATKLAYKQRLLACTDGMYFKVNELGGDIGEFAAGL